MATCLSVTARTHAHTHSHTLTHTHRNTYTHHWSFLPVISPSISVAGGGSVLSVLLPGAVTARWDVTRVQKLPPPPELLDVSSHEGKGHMGEGHAVVLRSTEVVTHTTKPTG